jgi:hypothetical protein
MNFQCQIKLSKCAGVFVWNSCTTVADFSEIFCLLQRLWMEKRCPERQSAIIHFSSHRMSSKFPALQNHHSCTRKHIQESYDTSIWLNWERCFWIELLQMSPNIATKCSEHLQVLHIWTMSHSLNVQSLPTCYFLLDYEERICGLKIYNCVAHDIRATCHVFVQNKFL